MHAIAVGDVHINSRSSTDEGAHGGNRSVAWRHHLAEGGRQALTLHRVDSRNPGQVFEAQMRVCWAVHTELANMR